MRIVRKKNKRVLQLKNIFNNLIVVGASRGIGAAVAEHLVSRTNRLISVSRSASKFGESVLKKFKFQR